MILGLKQDLTALHNLESELSNLLQKKLSEMTSRSIETSRESRQARAFETLDFSQIAYGSNPISRKLLDNVLDTNSNPDNPETPRS